MKDYKRIAFRKLYKIIVEGEKTYNHLSEEYWQSLIKLAIRNKVLLELLRRINYRGKLRTIEEQKLAKIIEAIECLECTLDGIEHYYFKLVKPVAYVPSDIDILVPRENVGKTLKKLLSYGYKIVVKEPYTVTFKNKGIIIDLYLQPSIAGSIVYLYTEELLNHVTESYYYGIKIPTLKSYIEALVTATHALYKERTYTLNDYITVTKYITKETWYIAKKTFTYHALEKIQEINKKIRNNMIITPYKVSLAEYLLLLMKKILSDPIIVVTSPLVLKKITDRRLGSFIMSKFGKQNKT